MERRVRYEVLQNEEEEEAVPLAPEPVELQPVVEAPAATAEASAATAATWMDNELMKEPPVPPSYEMATSLPSYEEAEQTKQEEMERLQREQENDSRASQTIPGLGHFSEMQLGTDGMFLCMFIIAFLFNWVGLLVSVCMTHTIAGRFGAIAGFGLSMVKWVAIAKHNNWGSGVAEGDSWIWWLLIILGFLIFFRGCTQYLRIKYQWTRLNTEIRTRMMFMF